MNCQTPITLFRKHGGKLTKLGRIRKNTAYIYSDVVPCGRCIDCLKRRQSSWIFRLLQEQKVSETSAFLTLTYEEEHIEKTPKGLATLAPTHHQTFVKRLRQDLARNYDTDPSRIKYYAVGEYGEYFGRPHFHGIWFNLPRLMLQQPGLVARSWKKGFVDIRSANGPRIAYCTKYCDKTLYNQERDPEDDRLEEMQLISKGIGESWITDAKIRYHKRTLEPYILTHNGDKVPFPKYYKDKLLSPYEREILAEKALRHAELNPRYSSNKHKADEVRHKRKKQLEKQLLTRKTLIQ